MIWGKSQNWREILSLYQEESKEFNNINYATTLPQLGRIRSTERKDPSFIQFLEDLATVIEEKGLDWIGTRQIANIVYSLGRMSLKSSSAEKIMSFVLQEESSKHIVRNGQSQTVANICWSMAKRRVPINDCMPFFRETETRSAWLVKEGKPQEVSNTARACATLDYPLPQLFAEIENHSSWLVTDGNPQDVSNTAWACAKLQCQSPKLFAEIENRCAWLVKEGNPQDVANMAWACATLDFQAPKLFAEIDNNSAWLVKQGNPQNIANTAWASSALDNQSPKLFAGIENRSASLIKEGNELNVANLAWASTKLDHKSPKLFAIAQLACLRREIDRR